MLIILLTTVFVIGLSFVSAITIVLLVQYIDARYDLLDLLDELLDSIERLGKKHRR